MNNHLKRFHVVTGKFIAAALSENHENVIEIVKTTYISHYAKNTINPDSYFLRFEEKPNSRIIALPSAIKGDKPVSGLKWIASYPDNSLINLQRASAVLVLNDYETGFPIALLEASLISAARTAASCVLAAEALSLGKQIDRMAIIGAGLIARSVFDYFLARNWHINELIIYSLNISDAEQFAEMSKAFCKHVVITTSAESAIRNASHVLLATTAGTPYIDCEDLLHPGQLIFNISLRDLNHKLIVKGFNLFDDVDHCMKAQTSPHLAEMLTGGREFVAGVLAEILNKTLVVDRCKPIIFSPFGLGVLDLAVGQYLLNLAMESDQAINIGGFFPSLDRW